MLSKKTRPEIHISSESKPMPSTARTSTINIPLFLGLKDHQGDLRISKSPFEMFSSNFVKSPKRWQQKDTERIGLAIVAAMNKNQEENFSSKSFISAISAVPINNQSVTSQPIPIVSAKESPKLRKRMLEEELSESYTCVISYHGPNSVRKHEYFSEKSGEEEEEVETHYQWRDCGVFFASPPRFQETIFYNDDFLKNCYLCRKWLDDQDIYMYRGDKAFCSAECRFQQIMIDEYREKRWPETMKPCDCSVSASCSSSRIFTAGVAAA